MVSGGDFYLHRLDSGRRLETDGANLSFDVSDLRNGSAAGAYRKDNGPVGPRWKPGTRHGTEFDGSGYAPRYSVHGADFCGRICVRILAAPERNMSLDYTGRHSSINGLIRLDFAPLWFMTGLLFEKITGFGRK